MYHVPSADSAALRLHYNENTAGCSAAVIAALQSITREDVSRYLDYGPITARCEGWFGVEPGWVQLTNGLDEGLGVAAQWAARRATTACIALEIIIVEPAFEMYQACAEAVGARIVRVSPEPGFRFPLERVLDAISPATRLIYLTDPNNPTGMPIPAGAVEQIARAAADALVLVDEAYGEFGDHTSIGPLLARRPNVVVGRTFAKAHGLAGLRVGALVACRDTLDRVRPLLTPFNLNICAVTALAAALDDCEYLRWYVAQSATSRRLIYEFCGRHGLQSWPSDANFVLFRVGDRAGAVVAALRERGIIVRDKSAAPACDGCIRMTAGIVEHTAAALEALEDILASRPR